MEIKEEPTEWCNVHAVECSSFPDLLVKQEDVKVNDVFIKQEADEGSQAIDSSTVKQNDTECKMPQIPDSAKAKLNVCSICGFQTIYTLNFSEHMGFHTTEKSYQHSRSGFETAYLKHLETGRRGSMCRKCSISSLSSKRRRHTHTCP